MLPSALRRAAAARRPIHWISTVDQCNRLVERLLSSERPALAVDCEGPRLGRFGRLSLMQLASDDGIFLIDVETGGPNIVQSVSPLLESREVVKVFHDCREDASILLHQHQVSLAAVFDTQVAHSLWLERKNFDTYQASLAEVLRTFLVGTYRKHRWDELESREMVPARWVERPLQPQALRYAAEGVAHLLPLQRALQRELGDPNGDLVVRRSANYVQYAHLNAVEFSAPDLSWLRPGAPICAMLAARRPDAAFFKLNHSALKGAVVDPDDLSEFQDLQPGEVATCRVKSLSDCQQIVHLQREGHGELMFDYRKREMRRLPPRHELDTAHPERQSSMYGFGRAGGGAPPMVMERSSYKEEKPEVIFKRGKRGAVKFRNTGIAPPRPKSEEF